MPGADRKRLRATCSKLLGESSPHGLTLDDVLVALRETGYYDCIDKAPRIATVQLISVGHKVRDREFVLRYNRALDF